MGEANISVPYETYSNHSDYLQFSFSSHNNSSNYGLKNASGSANSDTSIAELAIQGIAITVVSVLGLVGNILSVVTFSRMRRKSSFTCFLLALSLCDSVLVFSSILIFGLQSTFGYLKVFKYYTERLYPYLLIYLYPIAHTAQTGSVYFTLVVTIERYFAVCRPLQSRSSKFLKTWKRGICISIFILLFSIGFTIPRWMEYKIMLDNEKVVIDTTELKENPLFVKYYIHYAYFIVIFAVPFLILIVFNLVIYKQIQESNRIRQELSILQTSEINLALMLVCVVVVFLLCNILPLVNNLMEFCCDNSRILIFLGNFLVAFNSSINFLIYYSFGERFRRDFRATCMRVFCCCFTLDGDAYSRRKSGSSVYYNGEMNSFASKFSLMRKVYAYECFYLHFSRFYGTISKIWQIEPLDSKTIFDDYPAASSQRRPTFSRISVSVISNGSGRNDKICRHPCETRRQSSIQAK